MCEGSYLSAHHTTSPGTVEALEGRRHEVWGIVTLAATILVVLSLFSYDGHGGENLIGPVGDSLAETLVTAFGIGAWVVALELAAATTNLFRRSRALLGWATSASTVVIVLVGCALLHLAFGHERVWGTHIPGGALGEVMGEVLRSLMGTTGAYIVSVTVLLITAVLRTRFSFLALVDHGSHVAQGVAVRVRDGAKDVVEAWREAKEIERAEREAAEEASSPKIVGLTEGADGTLSGSPEASRAGVSDRPPRAKGKKKPKSKRPPAASVSDTSSDEDVDAALGSAMPDGDLTAAVDEVDGPLPDLADDDELEIIEPAAAKKTATPKGPRIVPPAGHAAPRKPSVPSAPTAPQPANGREFILPPTSLLTAAPDDVMRIDTEELKLNAARLVEKLEAYGVRGRVDEIHPGPVVTMYEFEPQSGTKISKIAGLADDLAMALAAQKVRIVAPIPGKARVGFELPNDLRQTVHLREILEDDRWDKMKAALPIALGQDIAGQPVYGDLAKMPHVLVAGATGSGKSVGLNVMLASLLAKKTPEEVRMLMIDPKVVELAVFDGIPHMLLPVVTDMKKAALALRWAVDEMERRYQLFADASARNILSYNQKVQKVVDGEMAPEKLMPSRAGKVKAFGPEGEEVLLPPVDGERPDALDIKVEKLPHVVVVVDEFADLMMVAAKDVEACIARLAQKARAAGIHVILATQRPSVDVITGMIKANFPSRIAFKVSQREDSKTILGRQGAEHLLGMGDMLMIPPGSSDLKRVHCAFISEDEVKDMCDFLRAQGKPVYDEEILKPREEEDGSGVPGEESDDPVYDKAVAAVAQAGYCSISHIQRQLSVGYNKAAKLVDRMEKEGVVGPASGKAGGRREVLIQAL